MNIFSHGFFLLWIISIILYYTIARRCQWLILLFMSLAFYAYSITKAPVVLLLVSVLTYSGALWITEAGKKKEVPKKKVKLVRRLITGICIAALIAGSAAGWFAMLGNSYFTLKAISYLNDADRDAENCERNYFFYLLYLIYLPTVLQGPFNRFAGFRESLEEKVSFDYTRFMHGLQRFLWGTFKKLVLTARLEQAAVYVYANLDTQSGLSILIGTIACSLWLYTDFSGYMDMMLGMSGTFGISLPENFRQPYFSKSIAEFWRRWHITLGGVIRDYIMMPFIQSKQGRGLRKHFKKYGKNAGKLAPVLAGTFLVWICTSLWHDFSWKYLIWGMYYCAIISSSLVLEGTYAKIRRKLSVKEDSKIYAAFCMARTWGLLLAANMILQVQSPKDFYTAVRQIVGRSFFIGDYVSLSALNWIGQDAAVLGTGLLALLFISIGKEKNINILEWLDRRILPIRWGVYYLLIFGVLLFGMYGSQQNAGQFLYMQF
ncbi:MBOAT family O-acyltransferase [Candidatus Merdisoma sp. JLR.KK011]|uniref:MBOAT family O-acyltransferase n=1 Tax=Candidatus Merdisoma sp. JLR.KK011 TaxID=3114299 RepID=UPI002FEF592A